MATQPTRISHNADTKTAAPAAAAAPHTLPDHVAQNPVLWQSQGGVILCRRIDGSTFLARIDSERSRPGAIVVVPA